VTSSLLRHQNITKLTSQDLSILDHSQSNFLASTVFLNVVKMTTCCHIYGTITRKSRTGLTN